MRNAFGRFACRTLCLIVLLVATGCQAAATLPEGLDEDTAADQASQLVEVLSSHDYATAYAMFNEKMQASLDEDKLQTTFDPIYERLGDYTGIKDTSVSAAADQNGHYAVVRVQAAYANGNATYTISIDGDRKIGGLYIK